MKIFIGNYINWWGPYQIVGLLQKVGLSKNWCDKLGKCINDTPICTFCNWIENKRKRKIQVRIDDYDTWSMDSTLAYIILPMLKQFKDTKYGSPDIDWHDIPEELRSTSAPKKENDWVVDEYWHERWDWVLDEMIWAFSQVNEDWQDQYHKETGEWHFKDREDDMTERVQDKKPVIDTKGLKAHNKRMQNGFRLFGKYYQNLWD